MIACIALSASIAGADERIVDDTAYVLPSNATRIGLWKLQFSVPGVPQLNLGTYTLPYVWNALGVRSANLHSKFQLLHTKRWSLTGWLGVTYVNFDSIGVPATIIAIPFGAMANRQLNATWTLGVSATYTHMLAKGTYNPDEATEIGGAIAANNVQAWLSLIARLTSSWSLYIESRGIATSDITAQASGKQTINERTTVEIAATGRAGISQLSGGAGLAALQFSGARFRLRFGIGYGNFNVPSLNFVIPVATPFPEFDVFWVF